MDMYASASDEVLARLRGEFPGWEIERVCDQWMATRTRVLTEVEMACGLRHVLNADTAGQLGDGLAEQHTLATRHAITPGTRSSGEQV